MSLWWVGGYTADAGGDADGVRLLRADDRGHLEYLGIAVTADSPSFLAAHPQLPVVYAVHEVEGTVSAYATDQAGRLTRLPGEYAAGAGACHVAVDPGGHFVIVSCWGSGDIVLFRLGAEGEIVDRVVADRARDPYGPETSTPGPDPDTYTGQGRRSRAHAALVLQNRMIATIDLGYDLVRLWAVDPSSGLVPVQNVPLPPGSGPRHLTEHPDGRLFVCTEYSLQVFTLTLQPDPGRPYAVSQSVTLAEPNPALTAAGIALSGGANRLYVGVRGSDRIAMLHVGDDRLRLLGDVASGGLCPLHHAIDGTHLYVANECSGNIAAFDLDPTEGTPQQVQRLPINSPTMLLKVPALYNLSPSTGPSRGGRLGH